MDTASLGLMEALQGSAVSFLGEKAHQLTSTDIKGLSRCTRCTKQMHMSCTCLVVWRHQAIPCRNCIGCPICHSIQVADVAVNPRQSRRLSHILANDHELEAEARQAVQARRLGVVDSFCDYLRTSQALGLEPNKSFPEH